jgi:hypothetical protein
MPRKIDYAGFVFLMHKVRHHRETGDSVEKGNQLQVRKFSHNFGKILYPISKAN